MRRIHKTVITTVIAGIVLLGATNTVVAHEVKDQCEDLMYEAHEIYVNMGIAHDAYAQLRENPYSKEHPAETLHAAEYTLEEVMKSLNRWMDFIICLDIGLGSDEDREDLI